jgi:hypothetical protein
MIKDTMIHGRSDGRHELVNSLPDWKGAKDHTAEVQGQNCTFCLQRMYLII